jgi:hypothetical protein
MRARKRAFIWCNREVNFIFHLFLLFFVIFMVSYSGATCVFLDVSCYFKIVTNQRRAPAGGVYDGQTILSARLRGD